jgi:segregation and condensation protein B
MINSEELEALLFVAGEDGVSIDVIAQAFECSPDTVSKSFDELCSVCTSTSRPYTPVKVKNNMLLVTKSQFSAPIAKVRVQTERQPLSRSHLEVISLLLYYGSMSKSMIDSFRGVNSGQSLRLLGQRGMIEKAGVSHGSVVYTVSRDMLSLLGVHTAAELPQYDELHNALLGSHNPAQSQE